MEVDKEGLDKIDNKILEAIIFNFKGGPVGLETLAYFIGEELDTIEDVYEPYLIQKGFIMRTPRGRVASEKHITIWSNKKEEKDNQVSIFNK